MVFFLNFFLPLPDSSFFGCNKEYVDRASLILVLPGTYFGEKSFRNTHLYPKYYQQPCPFSHLWARSGFFWRAQIPPVPPGRLRRETLCHMSLKAAYIFYLSMSFRPINLNHRTLLTSLPFYLFFCWLQWGMIRFSVTDRMLSFIDSPAWKSTVGIDSRAGQTQGGILLWHVLVEWKTARRARRPASFKVCLFWWIPQTVDG